MSLRHACMRRTVPILPYGEQKDERPEIIRRLKALGKTLQEKRNEYRELQERTSGRREREAYGRLAGEMGELYEETDAIIREIRREPEKPAKPQTAEEISAETGLPLGKIKEYLRDLDRLAELWKLPSQEMTGGCHTPRRYRRYS